MKPNKVRPLAICLFRWEGKIFVAEGYDGVKGQTFYRPLGGKIEFGERGAETVVRELREEIGAEVRDLVYLGTLENLFTYEGQPGHEIVLVYDGRLVDESIYGQEVEGRDDGEVRFGARWLPLSFFQGAEAPPLYPDGLIQLIVRS
ncbi:MAG: NUDIX hydrolase [Anaerolineae bacterium]|nr:NUDIX hydrolase [Anaerolineae bacterium]